MNTVDSHECQIRNLYRREGKAGKWVVFGRMCVGCGKWYQGGPTVDSKPTTVDSGPLKAVDSRPKPSTVVARAVDSRASNDDLCSCPPAERLKGKHNKWCPAK